MVSLQRPIGRTEPRRGKRAAATVAHAAPAPGGSPRTAIKHKLLPGPHAPSDARQLVDILKLGSVTHAIVELLVSELVTNAVLHSESPEGATVSIALTREGEFVAVEVWDRGVGFTWQAEATDLTEPGGLGLVLVDRLADRWGIRREAGGAVWFVYRDPTFA